MSTPTEPDEQPWRVLFVEDDEAFVDALRLVLDARVELTVVGSLAEARAVRGPFHAACVDLELPDGDGVDFVRELSCQCPELPVVILTVHRSDARILSAFRAGARGYLLKEHTGERLVPALREAIAGGAPMSPSIARRILSLVSSLPDSAGLRAPEPCLTSREADVLRAFSEGMTYAQTANRLSISINTLRSHVRSIYEKLCVGSRTEAVMSALQLGLLARQ